MSQTNASDSTIATDQQPLDEPRGGILNGAQREVLGVFIVAGLIMAVSITLLSHRVESVKANISADLREKYGATIEVPVDRHDDPTMWTIDGVERNCTWNGGTLTLKCLDNTGTYTEIEKTR